MNNRLAKPPFRADVVGSYLRPDYLQDARRQFARAEIDQQALTQLGIMLPVNSLYIFTWLHILMGMSLLILTPLLIATCFRQRG